MSMSVIMVNQVDICCDKNGNLVPQKVAIDLAFNFISDDGSLTMKSVPETIKDGLEVSFSDFCGRSNNLFRSCSDMLLMSLNSNHRTWNMFYDGTMTVGLLRCF